MRASLRLWGLGSRARELWQLEVEDLGFRVYEGFKNLGFDFGSRFVVGFRVG